MTANLPQPVAAQLLSLRIIVGAMIAGVAGLAVVAFMVARPPADPKSQLGPVLLLVLAGVAAAEVPAYFILRTARMNAARAKLGSTNQAALLATLLAEFSTLTIIGCAMAEGVGLFGGVIYLISARPEALIAAFVAVAVLIAAFPTTSKFRRFVIDVLGLERASRLTADWR